MISDIRTVLCTAMVAAISIFFLLTPTSGHAADYAQTASVVSAGGGAGSSAGYIQDFTLGQSSAIGPSVSENFQNLAGFWHLRSATADTLPPVDGALTASPGSSRVTLSWTEATDVGSGLADADTYKLVRNARTAPATPNYPNARCTTGTQVYRGTELTATDTGLTNGTTYDYRLCAYDSVGNISTGATATATPGAPYTRVTVLTPNGGEALATGSTYQITWGAPALAVKFTLQYSLNNGTSWKTIDSNVTGNSYSWTVPLQTANKPKCLVKVTGYSSTGWQVGHDASDAKFLIYVVKVVSPNGGESWKSGTVQPIVWATGTPLRPISGVNLYYKYDATGYHMITCFAGSNPGIYGWTIPDVLALKKACRVKVELVYTGIAAKGSDISDANFTIRPAGSPVTTANQAAEYLIQRIAASDTGLEVTEDVMNIADESLTRNLSTSDGQMIVWTEPENAVVGVGMKSGNFPAALSGEYLTALYGEGVFNLNLDHISHTITGGHLSMTTDKNRYEGLVREDGSVFTITGAEDTGVLGIAMKNTGIVMPAGTYRVNEVSRDGKVLSGGTKEMTFDGSGSYTLADGTKTIAGVFSPTAEGAFETSEGDMIIVSPDGEVITITGPSGSDAGFAIGTKKK